MTTRPDPGTEFELVKPLIAFAKFAQEGLEPALAELIKIRASQLNGCAACLAMHTREARDRGESEERLYLLDAWRESSLFDDRDRAVLAWTEALTNLQEDGGSDEAYQALAAHFAPDQQIKITLLVGAINAFNRLNVGFRVKPRPAPSNKAA